MAVWIIRVFAGGCLLAAYWWESQGEYERRESDIELPPEG